MTKQKEKDKEDGTHANEIDMNKEWSKLSLKEDIEK